MSIMSPPQRPLVLIVDDEPDIHKVTKLSLRSVRHNGKRLKFVHANSGAEAIDALRQTPEIAVVLLDVVMENDHAGLDACRAIREELGNPFARILLRTGQPGMAPEKETIDGYDIDGYLPKAELTTTRLYTAVRTALRAWEKIVSLERHRQSLAAVHASVVGLHSFEDLEFSLGRILDTAVSLCPTPLAVLSLETFEEEGNPRRSLLFASTNTDDLAGELAATDLANRIAKSPVAQGLSSTAQVEGGYLMPLTLHRELGYGWIYLQGATPDELQAKTLGMLAAHAANALYSSVAQRMLTASQGSIFDDMAI